jgi:ParB-like chromosome segregation protein Spo0J
MSEIDIQHDVELVETGTLIPYTNNPKEHPDEQVKKIASSIKNYGWDQPIVVDENNEIIKGHGRLQAAELLDLTEVPIIRREDLTDAEKKASRIADNKTAESRWNDDLLATEFEELEFSDGIEIESTGFDSSEIDELLEPDDMEVPDSFDEVDDEEIETEHECPECGYEW